MQSRGKWRAILPQAIANPLATHALERIPPNDFDQFCLKLPTRMLKSASRRLGYLHDSAVAGVTVARWLRSDGPLGNLFALGEPGLEIVRNIAPVAPEAVLAKIDAELTGPNGARILSPDNRQRGQWISLIKTLGYDAAMFEEAAFALARFVAAEPERHNYNTATTPFGELFQLHLSGTLATPDARRDAIRRMAESSEVGIKACAATALDSLLESSHFTSLSHHDFGARPRDFGWQPQINRDVWDWFDTAIALAVELDSVLPKAREILARNIRGIWHTPANHDALDAASVELTRTRPWIDGWIGFRRALFYDRKDMPEEIKARLHAIIERLKPTDLLNRGRATVLNRSGGGFDLLEGDLSNPSAGFKAASQQAVDLGKAFANAAETLAEFLPEVFTERSQHRAFEFGKGLAEGAADVREQWRALLAAFKALPAEVRNPTLLGGYIRGATGDAEFVAWALDGVADDPEIAVNLTYLQAMAGIDRDALARLTGALEAGKIDAGQFHQLASGVVCDAPGDALAQLLKQLSARPGGAAIALDILHMHFACAKDDGRDYDPELIGCGRELLLAADFSEDHSLADYGVAEVMEVCLAGTEGEPFAKSVCLKIREGLDSYVLSSYKIGYILKALFSTQPTIALDTFLLGEGDVENRLERRSPLNQMEPEALRAWAEVDAETRYPIVGRLLSVFEVNNLDDAVGLSPKFLELLEHAPDRFEFLGGVRGRIHPNGWSGSLANILERRRALLDPLAHHRDPAVQKWLSGLDAWLAGCIKAERLREAEREESFE